MELKKIDRAFYRELGNCLHQNRKKRGYSLRYLAELTGLSRTTLDRYELGVTRITPKNFEKICKALNVSSNLKVEVKVGFLND